MTYDTRPDVPYGAQPSPTPVPRPTAKPVRGYGPAARAAPPRLAAAHPANCG
jgi:hypothetical protein